MAATKNYLKVGGRRTLNTDTLMRYARETGAPSDFWGKATSFHLPRGMRPGRGFALMMRDDAAEILESETAEWLWTYADRADGEEFRLATVPLQAHKMNFSEHDKPEKDFFLVEFADERFRLLKGPIICKEYNLIDPTDPAPAGETDPANFNYLDSSLNMGARWTWQEIVDDLWPAEATGDAPALPVTPDSDPCGYRFAAVTAWEALTLVLQDIGMVIVLDPINDRYRVAELGVETESNADDRWDEPTWEDFRADQEAAPSSVVFRKETLSNTNFLPPFIQPTVLFPQAGFPEQFAPHKENYDYDAGQVGTLSFSGPEDPKYFQPVWASCEVFALSCPGDTVVHDGVAEHVDVVGLGEARRLLGFASEYADADRERLVLRGIVDEKLPGEVVDSVRWRDYGDGHGVLTEYFVKPYDRVERPKWEHCSTGGSDVHIVRFRILSVDKEILTATAEITSVFCGQTAAGQPDQYNGVIEVADPQECFLIEPAEELIDREGWAAYMQPEPGEAGLGQPDTDSEEYPPECQWEIFSLCCPNVCE